MSGGADFERVVTSQKRIGKRPTPGQSPEIRLRLVDPSTTATDWVDEVETGWTDKHARGLKLTRTMKITTLPR